MHISLQERRHTTQATRRATSPPLAGINHRARASWVMVLPMQRYQAAFSRQAGERNQVDRSMPTPLHSMTTQRSRRCYHNRQIPLSQAAIEKRDARGSSAILHSQAPQCPKAHLSNVPKNHLQLQQRRKGRQTSQLRPRNGRVGPDTPSSATRTIWLQRRLGKASRWVP